MREKLIGLLLFEAMPVARYSRLYVVCRRRQKQKLATSAVALMLMAKMAEPRQG
jgi:hypothetical protein